jgi:hypothetical protein
MFLFRFPGSFLFRFPGSFLFRFAERRFLGLFSMEPPRTTRANGSTADHDA